jgi:hypothetical protein
MGRCKLIIGELATHLQVKASTLANLGLDSARLAGLNQSSDGITTI